MKRAFLLLALSVLMLAGCDNPQGNVDKIRQEIADFRDAPSEEKKAKINENLVKLQKQVEEMKAKGDAKAAEFQRKLNTLETDYQAAQFGQVVDDAKRAIQGFGEALKEGAKTFQDTLKDNHSTNQNQ